jgi:hypothetical protein
MREEAFGAVLDAQIAQAASWPESQARFTQAAENGLSAIEAHRTLLGQGEERIEFDQARFLSALLAARLKALAPRDIAKAWAVLDAHQSWLGAEELRTVQTALLTQDRLARAKAIAETLCRFGAPEDWRAKTAQAAQDAQPDDADFAALVGEMVQARADVHDADAKRNQRQACNRLLDWIVNHRSRHLEDVLAIPDNALDWEKLPTRQRSNLLATLHRNRSQPEPLGGRKADARHRCAMGLYRRHPNTFARVDLTHPMWGDLPAPDLTALIRRQTALADPTHADRHRDQSAILRHIAIAPRRPRPHGADTGRREWDSRFKSFRLKAIGL